MNLDNGPLLLAALVPVIPWLWRSATLEPDVTKEWRDRVEDIRVGLTDRATQEIIGLQREIVALIGTGGQQTIPLSARIEPGALAAQAKEFQTTLSSRDKLASSFKRLQAIGPRLVIAGFVYLGGLVAVGLDDTEALKSSVLARVGPIAMLAGVVAGLLLFISYVVLNRRLAKAESRSFESV